MSSLKPITMYGHFGPAPNPPKVIMLLKLLGLPYVQIEKNITGDPAVEDGIKHPNFTAINPNGRLPAITDPNQNNINVWESAAILQYLAEVYDTDHKFSGKNLEERTLINEWIAFQISGQAPMQGQAFWFSFDRLHYAKYGERAPDHVITRFKEEVKRVYGVLNTQLERQKAKGSGWIISDRLTIADVAWLPWSRSSPAIGIDLDEFPAMKEWLARMEEVPAIKETFEELNPPEKA
ncbi:hypothetical protein H072_5488 [Dactylellina haptotyla CBS 200.50]|uniref:Glutathione S-transferase n=1 Tax=Dactylellina haptotyla (strain CBS 200.50) TaxID=1284197 RepID=S8BZ33_DACHA|nr:hypothetical protein H072_5488 [Dactylellina haptotyla CBS 200.50]